MKAPELPDNESTRIAQLHELHILDTELESVFDNITELVADTLNMPIVAVSLIDSERQWFKSLVGLSIKETSREVSFCGHTVFHNDVFQVSDTHTDARFLDNPLVTGAPHIRSYTGIPLRPFDKAIAVGSLCVIDHHVRELSDSEIRFIQRMAQQIEHLLRLTYSEHMTQVLNTQLRQESQSLNQAMTRQKNIMAYSATGIVIFDELGVISQTNRQFQHWLDASETHYIGDNIQNWFTLPILIDNHVNPRFQDKGIEVQIPDQHAQLLPFQMTVQALENGEIKEFIGYFKALRDVKKYQSDIIKKHEQSEKQTRDKRQALLTLLTESIDKMNETSQQDPVCLLPNRYAIELEVLRRHEQNQPLSACFILLDGIDLVEEVHGHVIAEQLLKVLVEQLQADIDIKDGYWGCWGGYQLVLISHIQDNDVLTALVDNIMQDISTPYRINDLQLTINGRIGVCNGANISHQKELVRRARVAVPNREDKFYIQFYSGTLEAALLRENNIKQALAVAIKQNEFELVYQPKVNLTDFSISGAEALIRWQSPSLGWISPAEFISIAENTGEMGKLGKWILHQALTQVKQWQDEHVIDADFSLAINLSVIQLNQIDFASNFIQLMHTLGVKAKHIEVEITESMLIQNIDHVITQLTQLKEAGITIAVDDFGTGYSSLSYISKLPLDVLKIARSFVNDIHDNQAAYSLVDAIISLANIFHLTIVAEGVETIEQAQTLQDMGCHQGQGYYFAKPMSASDCLKVMQKTLPIVG